MSKFLSKGKDRWRSKPAATPQEAPNFQLNDDVVDFLKPSTQRVQPVSPKIPKAPRIDIGAAQRWAADASNIAVTTPSSFVKKDRPRRALGLQVAFAVTVPEIIGEGGEEAEDPCIEISRRKRERNLPAAVAQDPALDPANRVSPGRLRAGTSFERPNIPLEGVSTASAAPAGHPGPPHQYPAGEGPVDDSRRQLAGGNARPRSSETDHGEKVFRPRPLSRAPTAYNNNPHLIDPDDPDYAEPDSAAPSSASSTMMHPSFPPPSASYQDASPMGTSPKEFESRHSPSYGSHSREPSLRQKIHKMRAEEGKVLHQALSNNNPFADPDEPTNARHSTSTLESPPDATSGFEVEKQQGQRRPPQSTAHSFHSQLATPSPNSFPTPDIQPQKVLPLRKPEPSPLHLTGQSLLQGQTPSQRPSPSPLAIPPNNQGYFYTQHSEHGQPSPKPPQRYEPYTPSSAEQSSTLPTPRYESYNPPSASSIQQPFKPPTSAKPVSTSQPAPPSASQAALADFADRCEHMRGIFRLQSEFERPSGEVTPMTWIRAAVWWFLKGRSGMEAIIRRRPRGDDGRPSMDSDRGSTSEQLLCQPHVDLAKAWWILVEVLPGLKELGGRGDYDESVLDPRFAERCQRERDVGNGEVAEVFETADLLIGWLRVLLASMSRNRVMPPSHALIQGQDQTIWVRHETLSPELAHILSGRGPANGTTRKPNPLSLMAVADTKADFAYNRIFVKAAVGRESNPAESLSLPVLVSIMRVRNEWHPKLTVCTQKPALSIVVTGERRLGPSWEDVRWNEATCALHISIPAGYLLVLQLAEPEFRQLWSVYNHSYRVQASLLPRAGETCVAEVSLREAKFTPADPRRTADFPTERVKRVRVRVFRRVLMDQEREQADRRRDAFHSFRFLAVVSPKNRVLGSVSWELGRGKAIVLETVAEMGSEGPVRRLDVRDEGSLLMVFADRTDVESLVAALIETPLANDETRYANVNLRSFELLAENGSDIAGTDALRRLRWTSAEVLNKDPENPDMDVGSTVLSNRLRVVLRAASDGVTVTDRINEPPGGLSLRAAPSGEHALTLLRPPQSDLTVLVDPCPSSGLPAQVATSLVQAALQEATQRSYAFANLVDMHAFQSAVTGYSVLYDSTVRSFGATRRRSAGLGGRKKVVEAARARVQVFGENGARGSVVVVAFCDGWALGESVAFVVRSGDTCERVDGKDKGCGVRLLEAKFGIREGGGGAFVCLDVLEYPGECEDLWLGFEGDGERDRFLDALPCAATTAQPVSRGMTLRRKG
ncbi:hypothetical protein EJ06DRAFT_579090 [Trichodelitschia bisporula]|uniref:Uncharacterized protein n=1 Tax=Trichodelitschia bisporula TaxID=703511 RepID=A0A6G1I838_9PEZI|nr:hypothetical protein EJ06DRAFT_579090 [Trichodelitschia bisporula]